VLGWDADYVGGDGRNSYLKSIRNLIDFIFIYDLLPKCKIIFLKRIITSNKKWIVYNIECKRSCKKRDESSTIISRQIISKLYIRKNILYFHVVYLIILERNCYVLRLVRKSKWLSPNIVPIKQFKDYNGGKVVKLSFDNWCYISPKQR